MTLNQTKTGLLGDTPARNYTNKLELFNRFAEPELRALTASLGLGNGDRVLDAGCGVGLITIWLAEQVAPDGEAIGIDLSEAHVADAGSRAAGADLPVSFVAGDMLDAPFEAESFDQIFIGNALHHLEDPVDGLRQLARLLRPGGRIIAGQSAMLPDLYFAWDQRLEWLVTRAVRRYFREKYDLSEHDLAATRRTYGVFREAGLSDVSARTTVIERTAPLGDVDRDYFQHCIFEGFWGERVRPYLSADDWVELEQLCDPDSPHYVLDRPDFHHIQTYTVIAGQVAE